MTRQVSSTIHSARSTVSPVVNIAFNWNFFCFADSKSRNGRTDGRATRVKTIITTGRDWGSAEWINIPHILYLYWIMIEKHCVRSNITTKIILKVRLWVIEQNFFYHEDFTRSHAHILHRSQLCACANLAGAKNSLQKHKQRNWQTCYLEIHEQNGRVL